jgi:hypothetical protein
MKATTLLAVCGLALAATGPAAMAQDAGMSFFVTSEGPGDGSNLGGLEGADAHCAKLAEAAGTTGKTWRAYLSSADTNARDRIGNGPWHNATGAVVAENLEALHGDANNISKQVALSEKGEEIAGRGDKPNRHDILTGSNVDGTAMADMTCNDWTGNGEGSAMVGHHDRMGLDDSDAAKSWNSSHPSKGCSQENLQSTGGDGLFYCFAVTE